MLRRLFFAACLAVAGVIASTGYSQAAQGPDAPDVAIGTALVVVGVMAFLSLMYLLRVVLGGPRQMPPEEPDSGHH